MKLSLLFRAPQTEGPPCTAWTCGIVPTPLSEQQKTANGNSPLPYHGAKTCLWTWLGQQVVRGQSLGLVRGQYQIQPL